MTVLPFDREFSRAFRSPTSLHKMTQDEHYALKETHAPRVSWESFWNSFHWEQGEHVALIGPTGSGKTSFLARILDKRAYVAVTSTKPRDTTMDYLVSRGYQVFQHWPSISAKQAPKRVIWPDAKDIDSDENQKEVFTDMFRRIYREGGWCLVIDEGYIFSEELRLKKYMRLIWSQGRSNGISFVVGTQRPRWIPTEMYDQSRHLFFWRTEDDRMLDTMGDINATNASLVKGLVANLDKYQFLYVDRFNKRMLRSTPPPPEFRTQEG